MKRPCCATALMLCMFIFSHRVSAEDENKNIPQKSQRPDHILSFLYHKNEGPNEDVNACDISFINTFHINGSTGINNYFFFTCNTRETDMPVPAELYRIRETFSFSLEKAVFLFNFSNNTNRPFRSFNDFAITSAMYYEIYRRENHSLKFGVNYSSLINRNIGLPIPIPMISYNFVNENLDFTLGLSTRVMWKPKKFFTFRFRYVPVASVFAAFEVKPLSFMILGTEYSYDKDVYMINGRDDKEENLFYEYQRVGERVSIYVHRNIALILFAGYQFAASYIYGKSEFKRYQGKYRVKHAVDNACVVQAGCRLLF